MCGMVVIEIKRGSIGEYSDKASVKRALEVKNILADIETDGVSNDLRQRHKLRAVICARLGRRFRLVFKTDDMGQHQLCFFPASFSFSLVNVASSIFLDIRG
jgi:hypothetical protein